jgi:UDP-N-acetylmuramoyl-tripeptide--D-alanyl-D-alanine ligase
MAIERNISLQAIDAILKSRHILHWADCVIKKIRMKGWSITIEQLLQKCNIKYEVSPAAKKNLKKKVQSVCTVNEYFERNSLCFEMYWAADEDLKWAVEKGALAVVTKKQIADLPCIIVDNPLEVYGRMCLYFRELHSQVSATLVTGSIGKTTTKRMIESVYKQQYRTVTNPTNRNLLCHMGYDMQHIPSRTEKIIEEVSEDSPGYAFHSSVACRPRTVVITSVDKSHFENFGSQEAIVEEICSVTRAMDKDGCVIVNKDDFEYYDLVDAKITKVSTTDESADIYAQNIHLTSDGLEFDIVAGTQRHTNVKLHNIYAKHNVLIALYAYAAGRAEGVTPQNIIKGIEQFKMLGIRQNIFRTSDGILVYADCFNAVAKSIKSAIDSAQTIPLSCVNGENSVPRRIAVLGDIAEVGDLTMSMHEDVIRYVDESNFDYLFFAGSKLKAAWSNVKTRDSLKVVVCEDNKHIVSELKKIAPSDGDLVLLKGSHSSHLEEVMLSSFPETRTLITEERKAEITWRKKVVIS